MDTTGKLIVGCGYLGSRIAQRWKTQGCKVFALTRSVSRAARWRESGIHPLIGDVCEKLPPLPEVDTIVHAVGFDRSAGRDMRSVYVDGLNNVITHAPSGLRTFLYISSTGVYGQSCGEWVDEESICQPSREGGRICLEAEQLLQASRWMDRAIILRLAGIYGPGRVPRQADVKNGQPLTVSPDGFLNLIHVEDAADIAVAATAHANPPKLYCVSDGHPCTRDEYFTELARLLGAPPPRFGELDADSHQAQRASASKRIRNQRLMRELAPRLKHPTFREGLRAILDSDGHSGESDAVAGS